MARNLSGSSVPRALIRDALAKLLADQPGPVTVRDLATAVYHFLDNDRVSYSAVALELRRMAADGLARKTDAGLWVGGAS